MMTAWLIIGAVTPPAKKNPCERTVMRIVTCKPGHSLEIKLKTEIRPDLPAQRLIAQGYIEIFVGRVKENEIKLAIMVPRQLAVVHNQKRRCREGNGVCTIIEGEECAGARAHNLSINRRRRDNKTITGFRGGVRKTGK